jgi:hypothetical protein
MITVRRTAYMTKKEAFAEIFVTAFKTLPEAEKETIVEKLLAELDKGFTKEEWDKIGKLAGQRGKVFSSANEAKSYLQKL